MPEETVFVTENKPEVHTRTVDSDMTKIPDIWRKDFIDENCPVSIGDIISIYTEHLMGPSTYEIGEILINLFIWCRSGDPIALQKAYEHMFYMNRYMYGENLRNYKGARQ